SPKAEGAVMGPVRRKTVAWLSAAVVALCGCAPAPRSDDAGGRLVPTQGDMARGPFVSAANPLAVEAGMQVLRRGGSAVGAAVAIQAVRGVVEPQSSGLGGGAFMMVHDAETGAVTVYDGRETAPAAATPELFYEDGKPLPFMDAVLS